MYYSSSLLEKYISIDQDPKQLAKDLTLKSCEIEEVIERKIPKGIIIGKCESIKEHPNADKLSVVEVNCGDKGNFQIVCGGSNLNKGSYVPVALTDTYLPSIDLKIKQTTIRDIDSCGMICSKEELGINLDTDKKWIWNLEKDLDLSDKDIGVSLIVKFPGLNSSIYDVENKTITHRPDLTGHFGLAMELKGMYSKDKNKISNFGYLDKLVKQIKQTDIIEKLNNHKKSDKNLKIETDKVRSYLIFELNSIDVQDSSFFTKLIMKDLELDPKNNWVDFSNIFMNLTSNPVHFFDKDKIQGDVVVRNAKDGEEFIDLMDNKHTLKSQDIVIADKNKILALAGVIGSKASAVDKNTKNILLELANFDPVSVRKTGTRLGLRTDAELRFEKDINPLFTLHLFDVFLEELINFKKDLGSISRGGVRFFIQKEFNSTRVIDLNLDKASKIIFGKSRNIEDIILSTIKPIGFEVQNDNNHLKVKPPVWRGPSDIEIPEDVYEEIARLYGYNNIDQKPLYTKVSMNEYNNTVKLHRQAERTLVERCNCDQIETYPWVKDELLDVFDVDKNGLFQLVNPTAPNKTYMRDEMFYNIIDKISINAKFFDSIDIFEIGQVWKLDDNINTNKDDSINTNQLTNEHSSLIVGSYQKKIKNYKQDQLLAMKQKLNTLLDNLNIQGKIDYNTTDKKHLHPVKQADIILNGQTIGKIGQLHPLYLQKFKLNETSQLVYMQLNMELLEKIYDKQNSKGLDRGGYESLQDQIVYRDLNFVIDIDAKYGDIIDQIKKIKEIKNISVFDVYSGENLDKNQKSIAIKLKIKGDGNYSTDDINKIMNKAISNAKKVGAKLRGEQ